ncbi:MAG: tetratricopeptide repeat protein [Bryobacterales bacterium]|nr:tetratricopeptide repeat protein [Bryobacterales bacterium]MBV9398558.1 tetratricopeptide repeat protein [Bryobacterales bacterium]
MATKRADPAGRLNQRDLWLAALLVSLLLLAYIPALSGGMVWDDDAHITRPELRSLGGLGRIWFQLGSTQQYYPLLHTAFWLEYALWGGDVRGYHLTNLALHACSALLLVVLLRRLEMPGAWLAGFLFALHPVCVESIAWISEQKNALSTAFYLGSALVYLRFDQSRRRADYYGALALFVAALLSKTVTATLPAALLVVLWWRRGKLDLKRDVRPLLPWLAMGVAAGIFTAWVERRYIGAGGANFSLALLQRVLLSGRILWFYLAKLVLPINLLFTYPRWTVDPRVWWQWLFPTGAVILAAALVLLARRFRGPLAGFLFFAGTLFPVLGFLNVYPFIFSFVADHFQYQASLGILVPAAYGLNWASRKHAIIPAIVIAAMAALTWNQTGVFRDAETLYRDTLARNPDSWMAHNNLGFVLAAMPGHRDEAIQHLEAAVRLNPGAAEAHMNLGVFLAETGHLEEAVAHYRAALEIYPTYAVVHNDLGAALSQLPGRSEDAIEEYRAALRINPNYAEAHNNLGSLLLHTADGQSTAIKEFQEALRLNPGLVEAHANLGSALASTPGRQDEAIFHLQEALRVRPDLQAERQLLSNLLAARQR